MRVDLRKSLKSLSLLAGGCLVSFLGVYGGEYVAKKSGRAFDEKGVAFRVGMRERYVDYDLSSLLKYMQCKYEEEGYDFRGISYSGDLYPQRLNNAGVNVFVRGYQISLDKRYVEKAHNVYFVHKFTGGHIEEFRNFDEYVSTQKDLVNAAKYSGIDVKYFETGACKREKLAWNKNARDVVYIYEQNHGVVENLGLQNIYVKKFSSLEFEKLSEEKKAEVLYGAKVVIYDCDEYSLSIDEYMPFAVFNLLSYGRPVITNWRKRVKKDIDGLDMFINFEDLVRKLRQY